MLGSNKQRAAASFIAARTNASIVPYELFDSGNEKSEKVSRSSSVCDYQEEFECMEDYSTKESDDDDVDNDDEENLMKKNRIKEKKCRRDYSNIPSTTPTMKNIQAGEAPFSGSSIKSLLAHHDAKGFFLGFEEDVMKNTLAMEKKHFPVLNSKTCKYLQYRENIIHYVLDCCSRENYSAMTADVTIVYIDRVLSASSNIPESTYKLVALCCLHIAVKCEEIEEVVLNTTTLREKFGPMFNNQVIINMEMAVLIELNWNLSCVTTAHFIDFILKLCDGATHECDVIGKAGFKDAKETGNMFDEEEGWNIGIVDKLYSLSFDIYKLVLTDAEIRSTVLPSVLAVACISSARKKLSLFPAVTRELKIAGDIKDLTCVNYLMKHILNLYDYEQLTDTMDDFGKIVDSPNGVLESTM